MIRLIFKNDFCHYPSRLFFSFSKSVIQTLFATMFSQGLTALGAATVFFFKKVNQRVLKFSHLDWI
jgi:hypothetical protein